MSQSCHPLQLSFGLLTTYNSLLNEIIAIVWVASTTKYSRTSLPILRNHAGKKNKPGKMWDLEKWTLHSWNLSSFRWRVTGTCHGVWWMTSRYVPPTCRWAVYHTCINLTWLHPLPYLLPQWTRAQHCQLELKLLLPHNGRATRFWKIRQSGFCNCMDVHTNLHHLFASFTSF